MKAQIRKGSRIWYFVTPVNTIIACETFGFALYALSQWFTNADFRELWSI